MRHPLVVRVLETRQEGEGMATLILPWTESPLPGNFFMVWLPTGVGGSRLDEASDEVPMSVSGIGDGLITITVKTAGPTTNELAKLSKGDPLGISGPFGSSYRTDSTNPLLIGGGVGIASIKPLYDHLIEQDTPINLIAGGRTQDEIPFWRELQTRGSTAFTTEDGSLGQKGTVIDALESINLDNHDMVQACGPMPMLKALWLKLKNTDIELEFSLESYMRCGRGICGSCAKKGIRICTDGPIFNKKNLEAIGLGDTR